MHAARHYEYTSSCFADVKETKSALVLSDVVFAWSSFVWLKEVDWEVELAFVIGRRGKHIKVSVTTPPLMFDAPLKHLHRLHFHSSCCSGGRCSLLRGRVHCGQWRQRARLADEAQREAVAAGKNVWQLLSSRPCLSNNRRCERWETEWDIRTAGSARRKRGIKDSLVNHTVICNLYVSSFTEFTSCNSQKSQV